MITVTDKASMTLDAKYSNKIFPQFSNVIQVYDHY